ncbi:MAG: hypothetical protein WCY09_08150 [Candidatus Omnitrophota bacterium]
MDVTCATCLEPWEWYHLRYDAIGECGLSEELVGQWDGILGPESNIPNAKELLEQQGYYFGANVSALLRCPCCHKKTKDSRRAAARRELVAMVGELLGDDSDGMASVMEDQDLNLGLGDDDDDEDDYDDDE